ncbi:MAG: hypothetical protein EBR02_05080, partial [Alphaproteobacteria bacterium]|nr:hypothetical protein [Alphaproteobacteria bacterium]
MINKTLPYDETKEGDASFLATELHDPHAPDFPPRFYGIALLLVVIVLSGFWLVQRFTEMDKERDLQMWQEKLNLVAESRAADVSQWLGGHFKELRTLASNPSLQLYMTELQMSEFAASSKAEPSQQGYLRNLLLFTAERAGYTQAGRSMATIAANAQDDSKSGLAIISKKNEIVVSTLMQAATKDALIEQVKNMKAGEESLLDIQKDKDGALYIGFAVPVYAIQGEQTPDAQIGVVIGIKQVDGNLFSLLKHPGITEKTLETILIRANADEVEYISPLQNGVSGLTRIAKGEKDRRTAEVQLLQRVGSFLGDAKDYRDKPVLATSRKVSRAPWTLVVKVDTSEALSYSGQRRASMVTIFSMIISIIALTIFSIWRYMQSHRSMMMSRHFRKLASVSMVKEKLLRLVSNNQPDVLYIIDDHQVCRFANKHAADVANMSVDAMYGKRLSDVRGAAHAQRISDKCDAALESGRVYYDLQRFSEGNQERVVRSAYIPIQQIPVTGLPEKTPGVLVVEQDISEVVHEREARLHTQSQLVKTLLNLVDKRDPFAANHSLLVSELAGSVAAGMELDSNMLEAAR